MKLRRRRQLTAAAAFVVASLSATANGQDRLALGSTEVRSNSAGFGTAVGPAGTFAGALADGGRFGLLTGFAIIDAAGTQVTYPQPSIGYALAADPARPRGFFVRGTTVSANPQLEMVTSVNLTTGESTELFTLPRPVPLGFIQASFAVDANLLFVSRPAAAVGARELVVIDPSVGASSLRVLPIAYADTGLPWTVTPDGTRLYVAEASGGVASLVAYDTETGVEVARAALFAGFMAHVRWSDALDGVIVGEETGIATTRLKLFNRDLGTTLSADLPKSGNCGMVQVAVSAASGRIYTFTGAGNTVGGPFNATLMGLTPGGAVDVASPDPALRSSCVGISVASAPGAPRRPAATVSGSSVSLRWQNVGSANRFTVDVGVAPGRTDLSFPLGGNSGASFSGVPAGTYYLRVRGSNAFGTGRPSEEFQVVVP